MSRSTIKRIQDSLESLTASVASLVAKDISQDKAINSTKAMLLATINTLAPAPIHSLATCPKCLECAHFPSECTDWCHAVPCSGQPYESRFLCRPVNKNVRESNL